MIVSDPRLTKKLWLNFPARTLLCQARGLRDFSGLVLDKQQKDRELARLDIQAAQLIHKVDKVAARRR